MKLVVCGKGGSGKSTIVALLAKQFAKTGRKVLVVDTDESNESLHRLLGTEAPKDLLSYFGGKKKMMEGFRGVIKENGDYNALSLNCASSLDAMPADYIEKNNGVQLVAIGKIHQAGEGCACPMGVLATQFIAGLNVSANEVVIIDTEAGIEHFGRGIDKVCDIILMIIDPSYESITLAKKVSEMAGTIGVPLYYVLNKADTITAEALRNAISDRNRIIGEFPHDSALLAAGLKGEQISSDYPAITTVMKILDARFGSS